MKKIIPMAALAILASGAQANPVANAQALCRSMDATGLSSRPCDYSVLKSSVTLVLDTTSAEARKMCPTITGIARDKRLAMPGWKLEIHSPYSNGPLAFCSF